MHYTSSENKILKERVNKLEELCTQLLYKINEPEKIIKKRSYTESDKYTKFYNSQSYTINNILLSKNNVLNWPDSTNICCWYDTEQFDTPPIPCPFSYETSTDTFTVAGCFCSWNCSYSYFKKNVIDKFDLFSFFYRRVTGDTTYNLNIKDALPILSLNKFGGIYPIKTYREKSIDQNLSHRVVHHPFKAHNIYIEETQAIDNNIVDELRLKRSKPLPGKYKNLKDSLHYK